ncbi:2Fe-2S iron-sulfur cluster-binding protein [Bradyrhizobium prioriisuperbiae]|uniref:2Fe-2S iron-sulfur cluster-binding protein n=1 Tax=Bradyrhizobium prioriisuperbiae TaxID=2854389 RepID=UPI0028F056B1|nr:2Fe-2S iron-sulfur cluster-binding protein [Bradyrhizobium prioritasuperba]
MPLVRFVEPNGAERTLEIVTGTSVMQTAIRHSVRGIEAGCGGCLDCATCHVYVDDSQLHAMPPASAQEDAVLAAVAAERRPTSRLGCQLFVPVGIETLIIHIPETQL